MLQSLISRFSAVDVVIVVACGERAGEVVETITEFPKMRRSAQRRLADGPYHHHLQHLVDAGGGA